MYVDRVKMGNYKKSGVPIGNLPIGSKVKFGTYKNNQIIWIIADKNHMGYPANSVTLISYDILSKNAFDAREFSNPNVDRAEYGNNRYVLSNIHQWLNKSGNPWFLKQHEYDIQPSGSAISGGDNYASFNGFLSSFNDNELSSILDTNLVVAKPTLDGGGSENFIAKVFLPSKSEVGLGNENGVIEGSQFTIFTDNNSRIAMFSGIADYWGLRSPYAIEHRIRIVSPTGVAAINAAYAGILGLRPCINLGFNALVEVVKWYRL